MSKKGRVTKQSVVPTNAINDEQNNIIIQPGQDIYRRTIAFDSDNETAERQLKARIAASFIATSSILGFAFSSAIGYSFYKDSMFIAGGVGAAICGATMSAVVCSSYDSLTIGLNSQISDNAQAIADRRRGRVEINPDHESVSRNHVAVLELQRELAERNNAGPAMNV